MKPLEQWICDVCGELIEKPEDGYVVWGENEQNQVDKIRIVHKNGYLNNHMVGCDHDSDYQMSLPLESFLGDDGKVRLLSLIDPGPNFTTDYRKRIADERLFLEFFRRIQIPYYEEARIYWERACADGYFDGANEVWTYTPKNLKVLIERYEAE